MKKGIILLIICGSLIYCSSEPKAVNGYFKRYYAYGYNNDALYPFLVRINGDTIVQYLVVDQKLDSTTYLWNSTDSAYYKSGEYSLMGNGYNRPAYGVDDDKVILKIDTTGFAEQVAKLKRIGKRKNKTFQDILKPAHLAEAQGGATMTDTLRRLSKDQFLDVINDQKIKDSIAHFHPYISDMFAEQQVRGYISFYLDDRGTFISNSLEMSRQADDVFHGKFKIKREDYFSTMETYIYEFNFDGNQMKAMRIN